MLSTPIKAGQINNLTDARYFAAWGVEWLGFSLNPANEDALPIRKIKEIMEWVEGPEIIGEFGMQSTEDILAAVDFLNLNMIQINTFATVDVARALSGYTILKEIIIENIEELNSIESQLKAFNGLVKYFVLDFRRNNYQWAGLSSNVKALLKKYGTDHAIIPCIDFTPQDLEELVTNNTFAGLEVRGGLEEKTGLKSFEELDELFELMEDV